MIEEKEAQAGGPLAAEFGSLCWTIDHLLNQSYEDGSGKVAIKAVFSTETAYESLVSQTGYFGEPELLLHAAMMEVAAKGINEDVIYVYHVLSGNRPPITQVIVDADLWTGLVNHPYFGKGTILGAVQYLVQLAKSVTDEGGRLSVFSPDFDAASHSAMEELASAE